MASGLQQLAESGSDTVATRSTNQPGARGEQNRDNRSGVAGLVEILQVQPIIPNLVQGCTVKKDVAHLELDDENNLIDQENGIDSPTHARDAELQEERTGQTAELTLQ